ncbi:hypothetical protein [Streptomyces sp. DSM 118148]|uniref:hypothetical protein n=1 Tax=Streptomyces sp. DSM 118148 TaxID=3448667 RepID=UPI0040403118
MLLPRIAHPAQAWLPTPGDTVAIRVSPMSTFTRAQVLSVRPCRDPRRVRISFVWTEGDPDLPTPAVKGVRASVRVWADGGGAVMVRPLPAPTAQPEEDDRGSRRAAPSPARVI